MTRTRCAVIVGAGLAGARCAETLRAAGYDGRVLLVGEEHAPPFERPALSKELLAGTTTAESLALRPAAFWREQEIELLTGLRVAWIDARTRTAVANGGRVLPWTSLVLATGARARTLPAVPRGVHVLRTLRDAVALRRELRPGRRLAIVGAGFIGGEVATSASSLGVDVCVIEGAEVPLERVLGRDAGLLIAERYRDRGIELRLGVPLAGFRRGPESRVRSVLLADGSEIACEAAVLGIGAEPVAPDGAPGGAGGIPTDASGRTSLPGVYACGDVASTYRPSLGRRIRVEHWTSAAGQGAAVAAAILGREEPHDDPPFFWSDQLGLRLQYVGHADGWARAELDGDSGSFRVRYLAEDGRLVAALLANRPREVATLRRELAA
jgi:3-phenylpropionate/trans-cinnamate dioxygenase ferredoxin reductase subunit